MPIQRGTWEEVVLQSANRIRIAVTPVIITYKTRRGVRADLVKPQHGDPYLTARNSNWLKMSNADTEPTARELCRQLEARPVWKPYMH